MAFYKNNPYGGSFYQRTGTPGQTQATRPSLPTQPAQGALGPYGGNRSLSDTEIATRNMQGAATANAATKPANTFESSPYAQRYMGMQKFAQRDAAAALAGAERMGRESAAQSGFGVGSAVGQGIVQKNLAGARQYGLGLKGEVMKAKETAYGDWVNRQEQLSDQQTQQELDFLMLLDPAAAGAYLEGVPFGDIVQGGKLTDAYKPKDDWAVAYDDAFAKLEQPGVLSAQQKALGMPGATREEVARAIADGIVNKGFTESTGITQESQAETARADLLSNVSEATGTLDVAGMTPAQVGEAIRNATVDELKASGMDVRKSPPKNDILPAGTAYTSKGGVLRLSLGTHYENGDEIYTYIDVETGETGTRNLSKERATKRSNEQESRENKVPVGAYQLFRLLR